MWCSSEPFSFIDEAEYLKESRQRAIISDKTLGEWVEEAIEGGKAEGRGSRTKVELEHWLLQDWRCVTLLEERIFSLTKKDSGQGLTSIRI